ncbi:DUF1801 domain-containing protein, partial [archaeon]|nr:DUF1801 domain-containing protein [archaeon]
MNVTPKSDDFISNVLSVDEEKGQILISLRKLILKNFPKSEEEIKYGGLVFIINKRLFCGIFIRKNHVSLEFDNGSEMQDPNTLLEGNGKYRRHLKINKLDDITGKKVSY